MMSSEQIAEEAKSTTPLVGDELVSAISGDGSISVKAIVTTDLVGEASRYLGLSGVAAAALGRTMSCSIMLSDGMEHNETIEFKFQGDGPLGNVFALSNGALESRGFVQNPKVELPPNEKGKFDVGRAIGKGALSVVRTKYLPGETRPSPYQSLCEISSGEIAQDINTYLFESEQRRGALAAGVYVQGMDNRETVSGEVSDGVRVTAAGGWYINVLPFADEETIKKLQENIDAIVKDNVTPTTSMILAGLRPEDVIKKVLEGLDPQILQHRYVPGLAESCPCSDKRLLRALALLPRDEVEEILREDGKVEASCEFCKKRFELGPDEIRQRLDFSDLQERLDEEENFA
jgi:molecular chaperone Hsp33